MISLCQSVFEDLNFSEENEDNQFLRYAIIGTIKEYFQVVAGENENVIDGVQQSTKTEGNIAAIEIALEWKQGQSLLPEQVEALKRYAGFGGLKAVL